MSHKDIAPTHLVNVGLYLGLPWMTTLQGTYTKLNQGKYKYHIDFAVSGSLGEKGIGLKYGKHIKGSPFYFGGMLYEYRTTYENGVMLGPTLGYSGGKNLISLHAEVGFMGKYETNKAPSYIPHVNVGVKIRLFRK